MTVRPDVAELLRAGYGDRTIAGQLGVPWREVARSRQELGLPPALMGPKPAATVEDLFWRRVKPAEGGHMDWGGYHTAHGTPSLRHGDRLYTAYRIAFRIKHGRDPEGKALPCCTHNRCVAPGHHEDRVIRERTESTFAAIFGGAS